MSRPLSGVVVVEAASYLSGPFAGMMLADLGAEVVKIEPPGGEQYRRFGGQELSAHWVSCNRGKRSLVADLKTPQGLVTLMELVEGADVFLSNWRPDVAERLGAGDAALAERNRRLIRLWVTGWGTTGPAVGLPAFDAVAQARSGLIDASSRGGVLQLLAGYPVDKTTALFAVQSVLAALYERERTGCGKRLDLAMLDVAAYHNFPDLMSARVLVDDAPADAHSVSATSIPTLPASDGALVIAPVTGAQIKRACSAVGHPEWAPEVFSDPGRIMDTVLRLFSPVTSKEPAFGLARSLRRSRRPRRRLSHHRRAPRRPSDHQQRHLPRRVLARRRQCPDGAPPGRRRRLGPDVIGSSTCPPRGELAQVLCSGARG